MRKDIEIMITYLTVQEHVFAVQKSNLAGEFPFWNVLKFLQKFYM